MSHFLPESFRAPVGLTVLLLGLAACSHDSLAPEPELTDGASLPGTTTADQVTAAERLGLRSNAVKYRDRGAKPMKVKAGKDSLAARALLGRDGQTQVEVTTGELDSGGTPPGMLTKVMLKYTTPDSATNLTFDGLTGGGYWSGFVTGPVPGQTVQVQGTVKSSGSKGVNVLKGDAVVVRRPDVAAGSLVLPAQSLPGRRVHVAATIAELNGDVGARFDCVLRVDGVLVDRAVGSWVDAGDAVDCVFATEFATAGTREISVAAVNVAPGDWDDANNSVSSRIDVVDPENPLAWEMRFSGQDRAYDWDAIYDFGNGTTRRWGKAGTSFHRSVSLSTDASDQTPFQGFQGGVTFSATLTSGEALVGIATAQAVEQQWPGVRCRVGQDDATGTWFEACTYDGDPRLYLWVSHSTSRATYFGYTYWGDFVHEEQVDMTEGFGAFAVASTVGFDLRITDAAGTLWRARASTPVTSTFSDLSCVDALESWPGARCEGWDHQTSYTGSGKGR